jgi:hypothetical protein
VTAIGRSKRVGAVVVRSSPVRGVVAVINMVVIVVVRAVFIVLDCWPSSTGHSDVECLGTPNPRRGAPLGFQGILFVFVGCLGVFEDVDEMLALPRWSVPCSSASQRATKSTDES